MAEAADDPGSKESFRVRAEGMVRAMGGATNQSHLGEEAQSLFHELRVHQTELEMQNEELRRAQVELEASRARYFELFDLAPVGYFTIDEANIIQEVNLTAARMFRATKQALVGIPLTDLIHPDSQDTFYRQCKQLGEPNAPRAFELVFTRSSGPKFCAWVEIDGDSNMQGAVRRRVAFTDITTLKMASDEGA